MRITAPVAVESAVPSQGALRTERLVLGSAVLTGSRALAMGLGMLLTAVMARTLGSAEFGLWAVLTTLPGLAAHLDLGVGNALRNRLAALTAASGTEDEARNAFVSCFWAFSAVAGVVALAALASGPLLPWAALFPHEPGLLDTAAVSCRVAAALLAFTLAFGLGGYGFFAYQETHWTAGIEVLRQVLIVALTGAALALHLGFLAVVAAYFGGMLLSSIVGFGVFLSRRGWSPRPPSPAHFPEALRGLARPSAQFTLLQLSAAVIAYTDAMIVTRVAGLGAAGEYALVQKLFFFLMIAQSFVLTPLWSAYTHAEAQGDRPWVAGALRRSALFTLLINGLGALALAAVGRYVVWGWTGKWIDSPALFLSMAVWAAAYGWSNCYSVFLNALGRLRRQTTLAVLAAVANVPLALWLGARYGAVGVCWAGILCMLPTALSNPLETRAVLNGAAEASS